MGNKIINSKAMLRHAMPYSASSPLKGLRLVEQLRPITQAPRPTSPREEAGRGEDGADIQRRTALGTRGG
jgi:hypothetical protein